MTVHAFPVVPLEPVVVDALDPVHLVAVANDLDLAGAACEAMASRTHNAGSRVRHLARASACYAAARLLRRIAE